MPKKSHSDSEVAMRVLRYFLRNPDCVDDLQGIARWRLLDERIDSLVAETARALAWLVAQGLLIRIETPGLNPHYRLRPAPPGTAVKAVEPTKKRPSRPEKPGRKARRRR